ncbi:methyltransferase domain-containing protein [Cellulomonas cellasea]|uniref:class I SAM-dependent methyltransferase n=1 Tax=Cellulomonas cellasea TaxID=43670 RepID=UPI0025A3FCE0|nr:methyltransferase domain-containing protein [Cellulomonas cellasea]MDM8084675.1 methyltransferase domain-containing protein [Cellulomonas cellasea]
MAEPTYRAPEALELPFDQYQRYATAARAVEGLGGWSGRRVLDVGGAPGFLELFFDDAQVAVIDRFGTHGGNFVVADGAHLPFDDDAFDIVISLDTLEHIPAEFRAAFLSECRRVAQDFVVLSAPHDTEGVALAENALQAFVTARFGEVFGTLQEHIDNGLPKIEDTLTALSGDGWNAVRLPSGYLPRWLLGMVFHHELLASGLPALPELHRFYNERQSLNDNADPSYRQVVVASGRRGLDELEALIDSLRSPATSPDSDATLAAIAGTVLSARLSGTGQIADLQNKVSRLEAELAGARSETHNRDIELAQLRAQLVVAQGKAEASRYSLERVASAAARRLRRPDGGQQ